MNLKWQRRDPLLLLVGNPFRVFRQKRTPRLAQGSRESRGKNHHELEGA
jgi:hypothetical protein